MANNEDFFDKNKPMDEQTQEEQIEVFKLGDKEYTQDELSELVGLGSQARELEQKWDTKIDRLMPEYTKSREQLKAIQSEREAQERAQVEAKQTKGEELSEQERARLAKEEARKLGLVTTEDLESYYQNRRAGEELLASTKSVISRAKAEKLPETNEQELLTYMQETGIRNPQTAYDVMYKNQLREIELTKLQSIRPQGFMTESSSTAGAKMPAQVSITKDNLGNLLDEVLNRGGGQ